MKTARKRVQQPAKPPIEEELMEFPRDLAAPKTKGPKARIVVNLTEAAGEKSRFWMPGQGGFLLKWSGVLGEEGSRERVSVTLQETASGRLVDVAVGGRGRMGVTGYNIDTGEYTGGPVKGESGLSFKRPDSKQQAAFRRAVANMLPLLEYGGVEEGDHMGFTPDDKAIAARYRQFIAALKREFAGPVIDVKPPRD